MTLLGQFNAMTQTEFMVVEGKPNYVMIGSYKDHAVVAELDANNKVVIPNYKLIKNEKFNAKLYEVGQLRVKKPEELK
ncbi:hypothetical protein MKX64_15410 [Paenibacillus sp. FSL M8-0334]|uniref:hypothetical protein n=1 Tax=Paenibacillus sp. FSL M8-0334 TaxID=2921623 RepID=UPI0030F589AD